MNSLRAVEAGLPPGFRFHPRDDELICDYLMKRAAGCTPCHNPFLIQVDLNSCEPWDIPEVACVGGKTWYFYSQRDKKYATGLRTNRATLSGYWKATGKDRPVTHKGVLVGMRKTLVFYQGRAPKGTKTDWVMHEFRLQWKFGPGPHEVSYLQEYTGEEWVLCRVLKKNRAHPVIVPKQDMTNSCSPPEASIFQHEQVPCFSFFNTNQSPLLQTQQSPTNVSAGILMTPNPGGICYQNSDENVIHKMESFHGEFSVKGFGDRDFSQNYLPRSELDSIWNI